MEIAVSLISFFALVVSWFVLPSAPRASAAPAHAPSSLPAAA